MDELRLNAKRMHCPWKGTKTEAIESFITFADALRDEIDLLCKPLSSSRHSANDRSDNDNDNEFDNDNELEYMQIIETLAQKVFGIDSLYDEQLTVMKALQAQEDTVRIEFATCCIFISLFFSFPLFLIIIIWIFKLLSLSLLYVYSNEYLFTNPQLNSFTIQYS